MVSKTAEYALRVMVWLTRVGDQSISAEQLSARTKVPRRYLHKVLKDLTRAGVVTARPGPRGGYALACQPASTTILDIVNAVAPMERIDHCPLGLPEHQELCPLHLELDRVYALVEEALAAVTLAEVVNASDYPEPLCQVR